MHYHVLLTDEGGAKRRHPDTFATQAEAEQRARAIALENATRGWRGTRYPGRPWRSQEVAVYLDRSDPGKRPFPCLELTVVRCEVHGDEPVPGCYLFERRE